MRYLVTLTAALFVIALLGPAIAGQCLGRSDRVAQATTIKEPKKSDDETKKLITSKHDRKVERRTNWIEGLEGDKARIFDLYGYPSGKYREEVMGTVIERWVYPEHGVTFKFKGNKLTR